MSHIRERLVDIIAWCLMKNHYHLLLSSLVKNGIPLFMHKLKRDEKSFIYTIYRIVVRHLIVVLVHARR